MQKMSEEQQVVLGHLLTGDNVVVDACAGSGKSTTILSCAQEMPGSTFLQMTYNSMLRHEVKEKVKVLGLTNIQVHTYHSLAVRYYLPTAHTDTGIRTLLYQDLPPTTPISPFDILVLDESQDMTHLYYQLIRKLIRDRADQDRPFQILVLGDFMQGLYEFKGADIRFLTKAGEIWATCSHLKSPVFRQRTLRMSYRITRQMADFVNQVMLGEDRLQACRDGPPVVYIRNSRSNIEKIVVYQITRLLAEGESPGDIFVLGGSVKGPNSNIRRMENALSLRDIPCHVPMLETDKIDERVIEGKVVFSTFHSVKGRQRKYVFVVGFDNSYLSYYGRNLSKTECPNTLYVGCTRATHGLFLLESDQFSTDRPLEFLKKTHHEMKQCGYVDFKGIPRSVFYERDEKATAALANTIPTHYVTPTSLISFVSEDVLEVVTPILDRLFEKEGDQESQCEPIDIPSMVKTKRGFYEDVSDLNGIALPSLFFDSIQTEKTDGAKVLVDMIQQQITEMKENDHALLRQMVQDLPTTYDGNASDYLYLANVYVAVQEKLYFKCRQIDRDEYNWLTDSIVKECSKRLREHILDQEVAEAAHEVEKQLIHHSQEAEHALIDQALLPYFGPAGDRYRFSARLDVVTHTTVWEIKCTSRISIDHLLQVVIYAWLWRLVYPESPKTFRILNVKTGERMRLDANIDDLTTIVVALLEGKYGETEVLDDATFLEKCAEPPMTTNVV